MEIEVVAASRLSHDGRAEIHRFCDEAYGEDLSQLFAVYAPDFHVLAREGPRLVSHAMVVTRWLQAGTAPLLRTAYVEMVATAPDRRGRGAGRTVMETLAARVLKGDYRIAALCPADTRMYEYLGWEYWQGPLYVRQPEWPDAAKEQLTAMPAERAMILRLPNTPDLDLSAPLSVEWRPGGEPW